MSCELERSLKGSVNIAEIKWVKRFISFGVWINM